MTNFNPFVDPWPWWLKVVVIAGALGIEVFSARHWEKRNLVSEDGRMTPQFMDAWPWIMRPGNILILVGAGLIVYHLYSDRRFGPMGPIGQFELAYG